MKLSFSNWCSLPMILPLASLLFFWIDLQGCLLDIVCNSFSVACRRGLYLHWRGELLFLEGAVWDLSGLSGNKPSSVLLRELAQGADGHDNANSPDYDAGAPFLCLIGHEALQVQKIQSCISQCCLNSNLVLLSWVFLFSPDRRLIRQCKEYSYYFIPQDQTKQNQIKSVKNKQRSKGVIITLTIKTCFNHRALLNYSSDLLR